MCLCQWMMVHVHADFRTQPLLQSIDDPCLITRVPVWRLCQWIQSADKFFGSPNRRHRLFRPPALAYRRWIPLIRQDVANQRSAGAHINPREPIGLSQLATLPAYDATRRGRHRQRIELLRDPVPASTRHTSSKARSARRQTCLRNDFIGRRVLCPRVRASPASLRKDGLWSLSGNRSLHPHRVVSIRPGAR